MVTLLFRPIRLFEKLNVYFMKTASFGFFVIKIPDM